MADSTKTLIGMIAGLAALVCIVSIMARCSVDTAKTEAINCSAKGGTFHADASGSGLNYCITPEPKK